MELHPAAFIETGVCTECDGPRYIREQPSRSADHVYDENHDDIVTEWSIDLPYRNLLGYVRSIENQWHKLDSKQKDIISNSLSLFVMKNPDSILGLNNFIKGTEEEKQELLNKLNSIEQKYFKLDSFSSDPEKTANISETLNNISKNNSMEFNNWMFTHGWYQTTDTNIFLCVLLLVIFLLIGVGIGYNC